MYLKKLTLSGFKSFADPTDFDFHPGTTAIVGPNGCGKSNVVDAFRWVLGERSAKELRGQEMMDVIFKGTSEREPVGRAEVSLLFDNSDGALPLEFSEIEVSRRLFRSGESEYLINRRRCRLKDVNALFADTGIGTEGYSILEQGAVDSILSANPAQRREIFEEAAGISRYKKQRVAAMRKLERVEADLQRSEDILREVERRVRSVKIQAGKARRFLEDRELLIRLRCVTAGDEIEGHRQAREEATFQLAYLASCREMMSALTAATEKDRDGARRGVDQANQNVTGVREDELKVRMSLERVGQRRSHIEESRHEMETAREARAQQQAELSEAAEDYTRRRQEVRQGMRGEIAQLRGVRQEFDAADRKRRELVDEKNRIEVSIRTSKEESLSQLFAETRLNNERSSHEAEERGLEALRERREQEGAEFEVEREQLERMIATNEAEKENVRGSIAEQSAQRELLEEELARRTARLGETNEALARLRERVQERQARLRFLEGLEKSREGISKGAKKLLESEHPIRQDVIGLLANCIEASPEVAPLVDTVLGHFSEALVFEGGTPLGDRARVLTDLLNGEGVTFCQTVGGGIEVADPDAAGGTPLIDMIHCEGTYKPLLHQVFADVRVVDTLEMALALVEASRGRTRYVTRTGCLVEPWGGVTSPSVRGPGLVSRRSEIHQLHHELESEESELSRVEERTTELELAIEARREELRGLEESEQRARLQVENLELRGEEARRDLARLAERCRVVEAEIEEISESRERVLRDLAEVEARLESLKASRAQLEEKIEVAENALNRLDDELAELEPEISRLRISATQREERILALRREETRILGEIQEREVRRNYLGEEERRAAEREEGFQEESLQLDQESEEIDSQLARLSERAAEAEEELAQRKSDLERFESIVTAVSAEENRLREEREHALVRESELRLVITNLREKLSDEFEVDLADVPLAEWRQEFMEEEETDDEFGVRIRATLEKTQDRLRKNSNVNLEAVNELEELEQREEHLSTQIGDVQEAKVGLLETIDSLNETCREKFSTTFEQVRASFRDLFRKVFHGGTADLRLEEDVDVLEAGVEITARPPGKRISSLKLLSGGEKALTATAILFALFQHKPSPFCILDEVDAPLDEANIRRFVRILKDFTDNSQFLIITHSKATMSEAERLYGITMEERGVSRKVAVHLDEVSEVGGDTRLEAPQESVSADPIASRMQPDIDSVRPRIESEAVVEEA